MARATVWLLHPNMLFREGLKRILVDSPFELTLEGAGLQAVRDHHVGAPESRPDLVLLDLASDGEAAVLRQLREMLPAARLVILTGELKTTRLTTALEAGIDGYLLSDLSSAALVQSLQLVLLGEEVFPTHLAALLVSGHAENVVEMPGGRRGLSEREVQILRHLLQGDSNKMIANRLGITEATVKVHLKTVLRKVGAANRTQAAIWALNHGFEPGSTPRAVNA